MWVSAMRVRVPLPIRALVVFASVATPMLALCAVLLAVRATQIDQHPSCALLLAPPALVALAIAWPIWRATAISRWIRATCVLVVLHGVLVLAIGVLWFRAKGLIKLDELLPLTGDLPIELPAGVLAILLVTAAITRAVTAPRRGVPRWLDWAVRLLLTHLLALGLLAPIVSLAWSWHEAQVSVPPAWMILAPSAGAAVLSTLAVRRNTRRALAVLAILGAALAIVLVLSMDNDARWVYSNFAHLIVANAFLALVAINLLGLFHWLAVHTPAAADVASAQTGSVVPPEGLEHVGWVHCSGWMEGLHIESVGFRVHTRGGHIEVPEGARIVAPLPLETIDMPVGASIPILAKGDSVRATGFVESPCDGPFRQSSLPVPSSRGVIVELAADTPPSHNAVLAVWRPCLLYLAVVTVIAIPGVIAVVTYEPHGSPLMLSDYARERRCGEEGQACCGETWDCAGDLTCDRVLPHGRCVACGQLGEPCCARECRGYFYCDRGTCQQRPPEMSFPEITRDADGGQLRVGDIQRGMAAIKGKVQACYARFDVPGMVNVTLSINPNGRVGTAQVTGKFFGTETGICVERAVKSARFPTFSGPAMSGIDYPFMLSR